MYLRREPHRVSVVKFVSRKLQRGLGLSCDPETAVQVRLGARESQVARECRWVK
jgi:hypothetical protein